MNLLKQQEKGSSTVEFALMLPLLLFLTVMVSELGSMFYQLNAVTKVAQITARYLSDVSQNNAYTGAQLTLAQARAIYGDSLNTIPVVPGLAPANIVATDLGDHVRVVVTYDANMILGNTLDGLMRMVTGSGIANVMTLQASSVMRLQ